MSNEDPFKTNPLPHVRPEIPDGFRPTAPVPPTQQSWNQTAPLPAPPQYVAPGFYGAYPPQQQPPKLSSSLAITSMVLGIVGITVGWVFFGIPSIIAVIFGHISLNQINEGRQSGRPMAITGLVTGYIVVGIWAVFLLIWIVGAIVSAGGGGGS